MYIDYSSKNCYAGAIIISLQYSVLFDIAETLQLTYLFKHRLGVVQLSTFFHLLRGIRQATG